MPNFMLLATAWGPQHGGINAFNFDFAAGLADCLGPRGQVFCAVFQPSKEHIENALKKGVRLVSIDRPLESSGYDPTWALDVWREFERMKAGLSIDWWVGHDVTTGKAAVEGPTLGAFGRSALIMHMNYVDYQAYKSGIGRQAAGKETDQRKLFPKANRRFANGPLLRDALSDIVSDVTMLIPGFAEIPVHPAHHRLRVITFGRMDRESDRIKQGALAVAGFASAINQAWSSHGLPEQLKNNPQMRVIGIKEPDGKEEHALKALAFDKAGRQVNLIALPYDENRDELLGEIGRSHISLMLSWHEGFGLTGWEAIAGEVPLIVSRQTGLWQLLKETFGDRIADGYVRTVDVRGREGEDDATNFLREDEENVRNAIVEVVSKLGEARELATKLKQELKNKWGCTWGHTAKQFLAGLGTEGAVKVAPIAAHAEVAPVLVPAQTPQSTFIAIPRSNWPAELASKGIEMPDSMLLRPESRAVRFHHLRNPLRDAIVTWTIDAAQFIKLRLQAGEGGSGKTRLMIEVCELLENVHGWRAGFLGTSQSIAIGLPSLLKEEKPCLIVLDYAESRTTEIVELVRTALTSRNAAQVRIVLLARDGGDWWDRIADAAGGDQATSAILRGVDTKTGPYRMVGERIETQDRMTVFEQALRDFASIKRLPVPSVTLPDLSKQLFEQPLFIHLAALATLRGSPSTDDRELLSMALGHERSYWRQLLVSESLPEQMFVNLEQAVALFTLCGGKNTAKEARELLFRTPLVRELEAPVRQKLFEVLRRLYRMDGGLGGLQPDLLGETLVGEVLASDDELLDIALDRNIARNNVRYALTVLTRLARRDPPSGQLLKRALQRHLTNVSEDALHVGMETGAPMPEILADVIKSAEGQARRRVVNDLRIKLPKETSNLKGLVVEVRRQAVELLENKKAGKGAKRHVALADELSGLAYAFRAKGLLQEAAEVAVEAARHASLVYNSEKEEDRRRLGLILTNVGVHLDAVDRFDEALTADEKAEELWRELVEKRPDAYTANWAGSLMNLGVSLGKVGRFDEALKVSEKAERVRRRLAEKQPAAYTADWALSLANLGGRLREVGRFDDALKAAEKAEQVRRGLAEKEPDTYAADWATSLANLSVNLVDVGQLDDALKAAEKAEQLRRGLAEGQPDAYTADWAASLMNLGVSLLSTGRPEDGLKAAEQAEQLWRGLAEKQPDAYRADWARSLVNLGVLLEAVGRLDDALKAAEKAEELRRALADKQPDAYTVDWASSLANLANSQLAVGQFHRSENAAKSAIERISGFATRYPVVFGRWLAFSHRILADTYLKMGRRDEALAEAQTAVRIWREIARNRPNYEAVQVAKAFRVLMQCEIESYQAGSVIANFKSALTLLDVALKFNPRPLLPIISDLVALARDVDQSAELLVPPELQGLLSTPKTN